MVKGKKSQTIAVLRKALEIVEELACEGRDLGVSELARRQGITKNQTFRILKTLEEYDYVHQTSSSSYRLGLKFFEIGELVLRQTDLIQIASTHMDRLRDAIGESVHLLALDGSQAVCIARRESPAMIRMSAEVGRRFLLHAGASPKVILAFQPLEVIESYISRFDLPSFTDYTITENDALRHHLAEIRERGYAVSEEDIDSYAYAIGMPIYDHENSVSAAMSVAGPIQRFHAGNYHEALQLLAKVCDEISAALGSSMRPGSAILPANAVAIGDH